MGGYNHYYWCNCGWCVKDRGYRYISEEKISNSISILQIETYESFTVPNVKCKCCGDEIFFYQSPFGGKVFFNELGHPWEKHCCEPKCCGKEIASIPYERLDKYRIINSRKEPIWKQEGWIPAIYIKHESYDISIVKITLKAMDNYQEYSFLISSKSFFLLKNREGLIVNFKSIDTNIFEISFYYYDRKIIIKGSSSSNVEFLSTNKQKNIVKKKKYKTNSNKKNQKQQSVLKEKKDKSNLIVNQDNKKIFNKISLEKNQEKVHITKSKKSNKNKSSHKIKKVNSSSKKNQEKQNIVKKKRDKSNLRANRDGWKGITPYKPKNKNRIILEKDSK